MPSRIALVTGAGRGIGRAVAVALAAAGHRVALTARSADQLGETASLCRPGSTIAAPGDITTDVDMIFSSVEKAYGPVEILVANAGTALTGPLARITDDDWQRQL